MEISKDLLNHPLAIVAILSVVFGFLGMGVREFFYFMKSLNKTTPTDKMSGAFDKLSENLDRIGKNMELLHQEIRHHSQLSSMKHDQLLGEIKEVKQKIQ